MERKLDGLSLAFFFAGMAAIPFLLNWGFMAPNYSSRVIGLSIGFASMATLIQMLQTKKGNIDGGEFSWRRWALVNSIIVFLIIVIQLIRDPSERISVMAFVSALIIAAVSAKRASDKKLDVYAALSAGVIICFAIALAVITLRESSSKTPWLFFIPLAVIFLLFTFTIFRERLQR